VGESHSGGMTYTSDTHDYGGSGSHGDESHESSEGMRVMRVVKRVRVGRGSWDVEIMGCGDHDHGCRSWG
jgi:hypothetical protein